MPILLTDESVKELPVKAGSHSTLYCDIMLRGFRARVSLGGAIAWVVQYRVHTSDYGSVCRKTTIGYFPAMSTEQARSLARAVLKSARSRVTPEQALRELTGSGSRAVVGVRPKVRLFFENASMDKSAAFAYLCTLEARYGTQPTPMCSEGSNHEIDLAEGLYALPGSDNGGAR